MNNGDAFHLPGDWSFSYGYGRYEQGESSFDGLIVLSQHKLFLKGKDGDIPQTFIPMERIFRVKRLWPQGLEVYVRLSPVNEYVVRISGEKALEKDLARDLVRRRGLRRRFLRSEWSDLNF